MSTVAEKTAVLRYAGERAKTRHHPSDISERLARGISLARYAAQIDENPLLPHWVTPLDGQGRYPWLFSWRIKVLKEAQYTQLEIAEAMECSRSTVQRLIKEQKEMDPRSRPAIPKREIDAIYNEALEGVLWRLKGDAGYSETAKHWFERMREERSALWWRQAGKRPLNWFLKEIFGIES